MKANELRIGNWIASGKVFSRTSVIGKVLEIGNEEREFEQIYCECEESFDWFFKDNYCGIPLTPEVLEKCGFEKSLGVYVIDKACIFSGLSKINIYIKEYDTDYEFTCPEYLHQLQNIYFALTGEELQYKP